ncbi:MAG TPA: hypothetical protein VK423_02255, partial [Thermoplasmata archaeon]|nr:hypothetical protein [Thermoplasmata archaeon]
MDRTSRASKRHAPGLCPAESARASKMREERAALAAAVVGSALWGLSGTAAQALLQGYSFPVFGLVTIRMLGASLILLIVVRPRWPRPWT